jgi:hypothetical protein
LQAEVGSAESDEVWGKQILTSVGRKKMFDEWKPRKDREDDKRMRPSRRKE